MEGRRPPPRASHPFPDNPDLTKFWGTPVVKPFFRVYCAIAGAITVYGLINIWLTRNETAVYGIELPQTKEEWDKKQEIANTFSMIKSRYDLKLTPNHEKISLNPKKMKELRYDDGMEFPVNVRTPEDIYKYGSKI